MKPSPKEYAEALCEILDEVSEDGVSEVLKVFAETLVRNGDAKRSEDILKTFSKEWDRKNGVIKIEVVTSYDLSDDVIEKLRKYISLATKAQKVEFIYKIDSSILGGIVLNYEDKILNASLKKDIKNLKEAIRS